jgi:hypothetical protein
MPYRRYTPDEIITLKAKKLGLDTVSEINHYLKHPDKGKNTYIQQLYDVTFSQLIIKAGFNIDKYPSEVEPAEQARLALVAERLTIHFLRRKLDRIKRPEQLAFTEDSELLDPHHHLNSIYVRDNVELLHLLPDFNAIYEALRTGKMNPQREHELRHQAGLLTDVQFLGRNPSNYQDNSGYPKLNPTVGYVRGALASDWFKEGFIKHHARNNQGVCRCCDMCGPETKDSWQDLERYLNHTIRHKAEIIRVHIGETHIPSHGKHNVEQLFRLLDLKRSNGEIINQIIRLGHGTHMGFQSMLECEKHGYYVEACLSSNKETGIIASRKEYPLGPMLLLGVPVIIGTDGGDLYHTDLKTEYSHAQNNINHFLSKIQQGSNEVVQLPNEDILQYGQVKQWFKNIPQAND